MRSGKKTKYLRLLEFIKDNPGTTYFEIVKNICSCTPITLWDGKVVLNKKTIEKDKVSISEGSDSGAYPLYSDIEFYEFLKENNYKLQIIQE